MTQQWPRHRTFPLGNAIGSPNGLATDGRSGGDYEIEERLHQALIRELDEGALHNLDRERAREQVELAVRAIASNLYPRLVGDLKEEIVTRVADEVLGLGPIEPLLRDPSISEVMVNAPSEVYYERDGVIYESDVVFRDEAHIMQVIDRIVASIGRHVDEATPMVDARLADGSRVNIIIPPLVPRSPTITIRKFRTDRLMMDDLIAIKTLTPEMAKLLEASVKAKLNIVVSGGTGTGKTTLLNAVSAAIPDRERIVTIEDPIELKLQQRNVIATEARPPSIEGRGEVTQRDLVRNALRMRPDRIIVGEVRGPEAFDMMQAMNTGHEGSLTTVHANSPRDALTRVESMIMQAGFELPLAVIRESMASALHVIIQLARLVDGSRRVVQFTEVAGMDSSIVALQDIFAFKQTGIDEKGHVLGEMRATGIRSKFLDRLEAFGIDIGEDLFNVARWR
jgi:pilus assembly protein CpaF